MHHMNKMELHRTLDREYATAVLLSSTDTNGTMKTQTQPTSLQTIISGGQTGADRAALDAGLALGLAIGGSCPKGRLAEDGPIDQRYPLEEIGGGYRQRTKNNVLSSDGTVLLYLGKPEGGTETTLLFCIKLQKPYKLIDMAAVSSLKAGELIRSFLEEFRISTLNVAGPREARCPGAYQFTLGALSHLADDVQ